MIRAAVINEQGANFLALLAFQVFEVEIDVEPLLRPGDKLLAVESLLSGVVAECEMIKPGHDRVFDFLFDIRSGSLLAERLLKGLRLELANVVRIERHAKLVMHPAAGREESEVVSEKSG